MNAEHASSCVAGVPRLFDLVRAKAEQVRLAFYFGLRDTVVADSLEQSSRIAYGNDKRWGRVVTLKVLRRFLGLHMCPRTVVPILCVHMKKSHKYTYSAHP